MKTIEIDDTLHDALNSLRKESSYSEYLRTLAPISSRIAARTDNRISRTILDNLGTLNLRSAPLGDKLTFFVFAMYKASPERFESLEGFTREDGRVIFFSRDPHRIKNSGDASRAISIPESDWFFNLAISQSESKRFIERVIRKLNLSIELKTEFFRILDAKVTPADLAKKYIESKNK